MKTKFAVILVLLCTMFLMISACDDESDEGENLLSEIEELDADVERTSYKTESKLYTCTNVPVDMATDALNTIVEFFGEKEEVTAIPTEELAGKCVWGKEDAYITFFYYGEDDNSLEKVAKDATFKTTCGLIKGEWTKHKE